MFNRGCKLTALLVAAAATLTMVPASAATRLETKDGSFDNAIAFNGKYVYDGYKTIDDEDSETAVYFSTGSKDTAIDNHDDYTFKFDKKYGEKYILAEDSGDYLLDLSTGKIDKDETLEDKIENLENKVKSTFKKVDRYEKTENKIQLIDGLQQINENQFGDVWYSYSVKGTDKVKGTSEAVTAYGFVNESGKYIDASVTANLTIPNGTSTVKLTKYNDEKDGVIAQLTSLEAIAQDENNIYAIATVQVSGTTEGANDGKMKFVQRISKAQGNKEDDAYLPSKVDSYLISDDFKLDGDAEDFANANALLSDLSNSQVRVINNVIYVTKVEKNNVTVSTIKLGKNKVTKGDDTKKYDLYLASFSQDDDQDIAGENAVSIDAEGNTWALNKGKIYKFNGKEFEEVYTCDRAMDTLDVYNSDNLMAWEEGEEVFAVAQGKVVEEDKEEDTEVTVQAGWVKNSDGTWSYYRDNAPIKGQWIQDGNWYYLNAEGTMVTGWLNDRGTWYYLNGSGAMVTGWLNDNGTWYYLNASGAMQTGWLNDNGTWYYLNASGAMQTGWFKDTDGRWYFLQSNGAMATNTTVDGYVLGANGAWIR